MTGVPNGAGIVVPIREHKNLDVCIQSAYRFGQRTPNKHMYGSIKGIRRPDQAAVHIERGMEARAFPGWRNAKIRP